jgi:hypothetical protein
VAAPIKASERIKVGTRVPPEVAEWLNQKSADVYKSRARFLHDLLVGTYRRERETAK